MGKPSLKKTVILTALTAELISCRSKVTVTSVKGAGSVQSIEIVPSSPTLGKGKIQLFKAWGMTASGARRDITSLAQWSIPGSGALTVDDTNPGYALMLATGSDTVKASYRFTSASTSVRVVDPALQSITLIPSFNVLLPNVSNPFKAVGQFTDGSVQDLTSLVSWASKNSNIASVNSSGLVTYGGTEGSTEISATYAEKSVVFNLTAKSWAPASVSIVTPAASVPVGYAMPIQAFLNLPGGASLDASEKASWSVSPSAAASISTSADGMPVLKGLVSGSAVVSCLIGGITKTADITISSATLSKLALGGSDLTMPPSAKLTLTALATFSDGSKFDLTRQVTWSSDNAGVSVTDGTIKAVTPGATAKITATINGITGLINVKVPDVTLTSIAVAPPSGSSANLPLGFHLWFTATATYSDGSTADVTSAVTWSSSDTAVAATDNSFGLYGSVSAIQTGDIRIYAVLGKIMGSCNVRVTDATLVSITTSPSTVSVAANATKQMQAFGTFSDGTIVDIT